MTSLAPAVDGAVKGLVVALVGNPNCGKTTLFNGLTGLRQKVGNYPGVTVEKKEGRATLPNGGRLAWSTCPASTPLHPTLRTK